MTFLIWLLIVLAIIIGVLLIRKYTNLEFVAHAKLLFKAWSVWLGSAGAALSAAMQLIPDAALTGWNMLPPDIKSFLPPNYLSIIGSFLMVMAVLAQFIRQRKLLNQKQRLDTKP
ncbi:hypothetical protein JK232_02260 [Nissabacter archeti]|uniref:Holin n=1 Tax=Nissabacter archeti TaxID=1917880 RepID=A0ABS5JCS7_9GAMM|nr:hypothetical protein [Nissabacter archeti]MBS0967707.1 hypothetical protein [Nissabacter archeti]